jgi:hypothetical protein
MHELRRVRESHLVPLSEVLVATGRLQPGWAAHTDTIPYDCDLELIKQLTEKAARFLPADQMDAWLAPRLHSALRIPRRIAVDDGMWAWLAFHCREFVEARFRKGRDKVHPWRYRGIWSRNALARLWWGAEMTRNGPDYSAGELCFARTRTAQFALELMYSWDRAAAIAFVRVVEGATGLPKLSDESTRALSTRLKVYLALRSLDAFGNGEDEDTEEFDEHWASHRPSYLALAAAEVKELIGPSTGRASATRVSSLEEWFKSIVEDVVLQNETSGSAVGA